MARRHERDCGCDARQGSVAACDPRRARAATLASGASGLLWALSLPLFWPADRLDQQLLMISMITGLSSGAIHSLSAHLPAVRAIWWPNVVAVAALCLWQVGSLHAVIALAALVYGVTGARFAKAMKALQVRASLQRDDLAEVAADLAVQKERAGQVALEVWDTGPGIAAKEQALVFEEFQRGAGAATASHAGLGLGLAIARRFAQVQGARWHWPRDPDAAACFASRCQPVPQHARA